MNILTQKQYPKKLTKDSILFFPVWTKPEGGLVKKSELYAILPANIQAKIDLVLTASIKGGVADEVRNESGARVFVVTENKWTKKEISNAIRKLVALAKKESVLEVAIYLDDFEADEVIADKVAYLATVNLYLASYDFSQEFKTPPKDGWSKVKKAIFYSNHAPASLKKEIAEGEIVGAATNRCRTLSNYPPKLMTPQGLATAALDIARENSAVKVTVFDEKKLQKEGMNAILAVGGGSDYPPRLIMMEYNGDKTATPALAIIGKGITFDSGGLNLKTPSVHMWDMHMDMSGGAAVIGAIEAIARLKLPIHILGFISAAENMISGSSYHQRDIIRAYGGKTMEIGNTDAEGRVVLADAIEYAKTKKPELLVTIATLTGASVVALGERYGGLFVKENLQLRNSLEAIGQDSGDLVWPLPLTSANEKDIEGTFADVINIHKNDSHYGGASTAAAFLSFFADKQKFAHIDMAPKMTTKPEEDFLSKGASGFGVSYFVELAKNWGTVKKTL